MSKPRIFLQMAENGGIFVGTYGNVGEKFYQNAGSGAFVSGPEIHKGGIFIKVNGVWTQIDNGMLNGLKK